MTHRSPFLRPHLPGILLLAAGLLGQAPAPAPTGPALVEAYAAPEVEAVPRPVKNLEVAQGNWTFRMPEGQGAYLTVNGARVGVYLRGRGTFRYLSTRRDEHPVLRSNLEKNSRLRPIPQPEGLAVQEEVEEVVLWARNLPLPALPEPVGPAPAPGPFLAQPPLAQQPVAATFKAFTAFFTPLPQGTLGQHIVVRQLNAPAAAHLMALAKGPGEAFLYEWDPVQDQVETLHLAKRYHQEQVPQVHLLKLSERPLDRDPKEPLLDPVLLRHLDVELEASLKTEGKMRIREDLVVLQRGLQVVPLDFYSIKYQGLRAHPFRLRSVRDASGRELPFHHQNDALLVFLDAPAGQGAPLHLDFAVDGEILAHPHNDTYWELGVEPWFPQPGFGGQYATVHATIKVPKPHRALAAAPFVRQAEEGPWNVLEVKGDAPIQFFSIFGGNYRVQEETRKGRTVRVATYADRGGNQAKLTNLAFSLIDFYEHLLGPFPFPELNIVQRDEYGHGQAPPGMMLITNEAFIGKEELVGGYFSKGINHRFAHEIAHQYWGHLVKMPSSEEQWLTESFAEYSSALAVRAMRNLGESAYTALGHGWHDAAAAASPKSSIATANWVSAPDDPAYWFRTRTGLVYDKGAYLLRSLHLQLGDAGFQQFLRRVEARYAWRFANTKGVVQELNAATGKDFGPFFEKYYWGTEMPPE